MATTPAIDNVYPAPNALGVVIADQVRVLFDQAMDETTINSGTFVVLGQEDNFIFGPDFTRNDEPGVEDEQIFNSPYAPGYVEGTITFRRLDASGALSSAVDYTGAGNLYRTEAIFTPTRPLQPNREYTVWLAGDENVSDNFDTGVRTRTVFDTEKVAVSGTGDLDFGGGYEGTLADTIYVEITTGGATGQAEYIWWLNSAPLTTYQGITTTGRRHLSNGVWLECEADGSFTVGDTFRTALVPSVLLADNYKWSFTTGSGSILTPPSSSSTTGLLDVSNTSSTGSSFSVSTISPENRAYDQVVTTTDIVITFSSAPTGGVTTSNIVITSEPVNGDTTTISYTGALTYSLSQVGAVVTATLDADQLYENNLVKIEISSDIVNGSGDNLNEFSSYFTTTYNPVYTSIRRVRLDLGPLIASVPNDTIMFAIFEASLYVDVICFIESTSSQTLDYLNFAKRQLATCLAELILLRGSLGISGSDSMTKSLGDLSVSRGGGGSDKKEELEECVARWTVVVESGGEITPDTSLKPVTSVKGATAEDALSVGRLWEPTSTVHGTSLGQSAANSYTQRTARRWVRNYWKRS